MRRKEETLRRQEKQTHSEAAVEERSEGRNEPLSDWNAIVADDVSVFPRPGRLCDPLCFPGCGSGTFSFRKKVSRMELLLPKASKLPLKPIAVSKHFQWITV